MIAMLLRQRPNGKMGGDFFYNVVSPMKLQPYPASWFLLGALIASVPWSWLLPLPADLAPQLLHSIRAIWGAVFGGVSIVGVFSYAAGLALFRSHASRTLSMAIGVTFGFAVVAATRLPQFAGLNFSPLVFAGLAASLLAGLVVGFRERRANYALKRTVRDEVSR